MILLTQNGRTADLLADADFGNRTLAPHEMADFKERTAKIDYYGRCIFDLPENDRIDVDKVNEHLSGGYTETVAFYGERYDSDTVLKAALSMFGDKDTVWVESNDLFLALYPLGNVN